MRLRTVLICLAVCLPGFAEEGAHHHQIGKLGTVRFQISCNSNVQAPFTRAVAMLHSFWYNEAEKAFSHIGDTDPKCGMTYWGVAMSTDEIGGGLAVCSLQPLPGFAEEGAHHHQIGKLGTVRFQISCNSNVQAPFTRAVAMLHSFWYNEAEMAS